jgi:antibiotic biosynthesis monooxygenase (ABM) superfamily enzyme
MVHPETIDKAFAYGLTTRVSILSSEGSFHEHLSSLLMRGADSPGFLSAEITPHVFGGGLEWVVVHRFRTAEHAHAWLSSEERKRIMDLLPQERTVHEEVAPHTSGGTVTASITSVVKPGLEEEYYDWLHRIQTEQSKFPGYEGTYFQPPTGGNAGESLVLLRFNTPESFDNWFNSKERRGLIDESRKVIHSESIQRLTSAFPGWMPSDPETSEQPANYKGAMLVLLGIQPIVLLQIHYLAPHLTFLPPPFATLALNALGISLITWVCMPVFNKVFYRWLLPKGPAKKKIELMGILLIFALCIVLTLALSNLP